MDFVPILAMISLIISIVNLPKYARAGDMNGIVTTFVVWIAGIIVVFLTAKTDFAAGIMVSDKPLADYNSWSLLFMGLTVASMSAFANDLRKALDSSTSSRKPDLLAPDGNNEVL